MVVAIGGGGCGGAPCNFGCTPTGNGDFMCGCPDGYQRIGQGYVGDLTYLTEKFVTLFKRHCALSILL